MLKRSKGRTPQGEIYTVDQMCRSRKELWDVSVLLAQNFVPGCFYGTQRKNPSTVLTLDVKY